MTVRPCNVIVAGVGGQGVLALTRALWLACERAGMRCQGSTFKGGAQTLGAVHSVVRIFPPGESRSARFSTQIPDGELDVLLATEPWEALRHRAAFGPRTRLHVSTRPAPFVPGPGVVVPAEDPVAALRRTGLHLCVGDRAAEAAERFGSPRMANFLLGLHAVAAGDLPLSAGAYAEAFVRATHLDGATAAALASDAARLAPPREPPRLLCLSQSRR